MQPLPPDHPERFLLANEVHARPPEALETPSRASYVAVIFDQQGREAELEHVASLCERFHVAPPGSNSTHFTARLGGLRFKWERHGEFSSYTFFVAGLGARLFTETAAGALPPGWLAAIPGRTVVAAHAELARCGDTPPEPAGLAGYFGGNVAIGAALGQDAGYAFTDFRIHDDGCARFLLLDRAMSPRQAGRLMQRLFEIEAYRMMALLALPIARRQAPRVLAIERALASLTDDMARDGDRDEKLLGELSRLAAEVESGLAASTFRFGAARAYNDLVSTRIAELREARLEGFQTVEEFMQRRLAPAMATCTSVSRRLRDLSERVARASALLSTRVDIARERQNQSLLASMDRRARLQLRLQQTVEGLSVAAITYYVIGIVGYFAKALKAAGMRVDPDVAVGAAIPLVVGLVAWALRRARRHIEGDEQAASTRPAP
jgi:uncharacterized membrane-anchored protein